MSHEATNWAIKQRGYNLKASAKIVLWHLCDRYHPDHGCFPSQETLAADCEMSRSALNENLTVLEEAGLIAREQRRNEQTNRQKSTVYRFAFEPGFVRKPCPESGHGNEGEAVSGNDQKPCPENAESRVRNPDTNPVIEPVSITGNERESVRDAGEGEARHEKLKADRIERDFKRWFPKWPTYVADSEAAARKAWMALSDDDRANALERTAAFVAHVQAKGRTKFVAAAVYLSERQWQRLEPKAAAASGPVLAPAFGKAWMAMRFVELAKPCAPLPPLAPGVARAIAAGTLDRDREMQVHREKHGWPVVSRMHAKAQDREGVYVKADIAALGEGFQPVKVGSETCLAWEELHRVRGWPWLPLGQWQWLHMPRAENCDVEGALARFWSMIEKEKGNEHAA